MKKNRKIALVTGATSGIGVAIALKLAEEGYDLIITGRRKERLDQLAGKINKDYNQQALPLAFDIRNHNSVKKNIEHLPDDWKNIDVLINNAGLALGLDHINEGDISQWDTMIDTNIKGLLYISRELIPMMIKAKKGHVVNIGSIAGKEVYEKGNVYSATKHAVDALNKAMRMDLLKHGIKVTAINPGMVETEFSLVRFKGDKERADNVYKGIQVLKAEDVAEAVSFVLSRPAHVNINDMVIMPQSQANTVMTFRS